MSVSLRPARAALVTARDESPSATKRNAGSGRPAATLRAASNCVRSTGKSQNHGYAAAKRRKRAWAESRSRANAAA